MAMSSEDSSCPDDHDVSESELELGLGLSLACSSISFSATKRVQQATAAPPPSTNASKSSSSSSSCVSRANGGTAAGTKRTADSASQVVGWPPLRAHRINSMVNQAKSTATEEYGANVEKSKNKINTVENGINGGNKNSGGPRVRGQLRSSLFVKVNMDGCAIGRKVDLNAHSSYDTLAKTLENMFFGPTIITNSTCAGRKENGAMVGATKSSKLLNGSFDFVLTYEDKEGDWMMVGDVPWGMFINSVKRLRIMKTSEANGLDPRVQEYNERPKNKPF